MGRVNIENLTKEEAIRLHREMWNFIDKKVKEKKNKEKNEYLRDEENVKRRVELKIKFLNKIGILNGNIKNNCFICEYSYQCAKRNNEIKEDEFCNYCKYCPLDWCYECKIKGCNFRNFFQCECNESKESINWIRSNTYKILNLPEKE